MLEGVDLEKTIALNQLRLYRRDKNVKIQKT